MNKNNPLPCDIAIVGLGIVGTHQITREVQETIQRCMHTFVTDTAAGVLDYLKTLCPEVTDLTSVYEIGSHRIKIYRRMASEVVASALENPPVCFASYGHPNIYCYPTILIQRAATVLNLKTMVLPGISSIDTLLTDLGIDPGFHGLQIYDASDLVIRRRPLQNDVGCVILQAPIVLEAYNRPKAPRGENLMLLQNYLLEFYPAEHKAAFVISRTHPLLQTHTQKIPIGRLAAALEHGSNVGTLYIPPVRQREVAEIHLADRMKLPDTNSEAPSTKLPKRSGRPTIGPQPS
jgi:uncharacterized protein YabN with tetrapyrrole methylase and pyrophosphatase domain